jgi:general secretion pathway protein G
LPYQSPSSRASRPSGAGWLLWLAAGVAVLIVGPMAVEPSSALFRRRRQPTVQAAATCAGLRVALEAFRADTGRLPTTEEGLRALTARPPGVTGWRGPYLLSDRRLNADPWGLQPADEGVEPVVRGSRLGGGIQVGAQLREEKDRKRGERRGEGEPVKSGRWDSNPQHPAWKAGALPLSYARDGQSGAIHCDQANSDRRNVSPPARYFQQTSRKARGGGSRRQVKLVKAGRQNHGNHGKPAETERRRLFSFHIRRLLSPSLSLPDFAGDPPDTSQMRNWS